MHIYLSYDVVLGDRILISTPFIDEARDYALKKILKGQTVLIIESSKLR